MHRLPAVLLVLFMTAARAAGVLPGDVPASYEGELPCADCTGIRYHLDVLPDGMYFLRTEYAGKARVSDAVGHWTVSADGTRLILAGGRSGPLGFAVEGPVTLRLLERVGQGFAGPGKYVLTRTAFRPIEPRTTLTGVYRYFADAGSFTPCGSARRLPVAEEAENAALQAAYRRAGVAPGGEALATVEGRIALRPRTDGEGSQPHWIADRVIEVRAGACVAQSAAQLEDNYWKLVALGETPVVLKARQAGPHLILRAQDHRVAGNAGCNRMMGAYTLNGDKIEFGRMATTMMACLAGMDIERDLLAALKTVRSWRIDGGHLDLFDAVGRRAARFEARAQPLSWRSAVAQSSRW